MLLDTLLTAHHMWFLACSYAALLQNLMGQFGSAQLRFFRQLCTAAKVGTRTASVLDLLLFVFTEWLPA